MTKLKSFFSPHAIFSFLIIGIVFLNVAATVYGAHWLRPSADDYCLAWQTGENGVANFVLGAWKTSIGYMTSVFSGSVWVGWPLANLPLSLASLIPFIITAIGFGVVLVLILVHFTPLVPRQIFFILVTTAFFWWVYLWAPEAFNGIFIPLNSLSMQETKLLSSLTYGLTHSQATNATYVIQFEFVLILLCLIGHLPFHSKFFKLALALIGFIAGMTGPTLSLSIALFTVFCAGYVKIYVNSPRINNANSLIFICSILSGLIFSQILSPGSQHRLMMMPQHESFSLFNVINTSFKFSIKLWINSYLNFGGTVVFLLAACLTYFWNLSLRNLKSLPIFTMGMLFAIFSFLQIFNNRAAEFFAYEHSFHYASSMATIFLSIIFLGMGFGVCLTKKIPLERGVPIANILIILLLLMGTSSNLYMIESMYERQGRWHGGPAPIRGVIDIETDWVRGCWQHLNRQRPSPIER